MVQTLKDRYQRLSARQRVIAIPVVFIFLCCCSCFTITTTDSTLRTAGILPTRTPRATATIAETAIPEETETSPSTNTPTQEPTQTPAETSAPTNTTEPTNTPEPTNTSRPTNTPQPANTATPAPPTNTAIPPTPAATATPSEARVIIINVNKQDEYVDIRNVGGQAQDLNGWTLVSETGSQSCPLGGIIGPGQTLRIWALAEDAANGGYNCGFGGPIWNNSEPDPAVLYDANGNEVSRFNS